jgi:hypothetical protein
MGSAKWLDDAVAQRQKRCKGHMRQQLFENAQTFEIAVNEALAPYRSNFSSVKASPRWSERVHCSRKRDLEE